VRPWRTMSSPETSVNATANQRIDRANPGRESVRGHSAAPTATIWDKVLIFPRVRAGREIPLRPAAVR